MCTSVLRGLLLTCHFYGNFRQIKTAKIRSLVLRILQSQEQSDESLSFSLAIKGRGMYLCVREMEHRGWMRVRQRLKINLCRPCMCVYCGFVMQSPIRASLHPFFSNCTYTHTHTQTTYNKHIGIRLLKSPPAQTQACEC